MKILSLNEKTGIAKKRVDSLDDMDNLSKIIEVGDFLSSQTTRKVKLSNESERQKAEKRTI